MPEQTKCPMIDGHLDHKMEEMIERVVARAFPKEDIMAHREWHEAAIRAAEAEEAFWTKLRQDLIQKGIWSVILILIGLLVVGVKTKLGL